MGKAEDPIRLLERWHAGDQEAMHKLLDRNYPRLQVAASRLLDRYKHLRRDLETLDAVNTAALKALESLPRFIPTDEDQFVRLLSRIIRNHVLNRLRSRWQERREPYGDSVLDLRASPRSSVSPDREAEKAEDRAWARLAVELMDDGDRELLQMVSEDASWKDVAMEFGISEDAARMRFMRLQPRLANIVRRLKSGQVDTMLSAARTE